MISYRCPRCGKPVPSWQPVHLPCLIYRLRYVLAIILVVGLILVLVLVMRGGTALVAGNVSPIASATLADIASPTKSGPTAVGIASPENVGNSQLPPTLEAIRSPAPVILRPTDTPPLPATKIAAPPTATPNVASNVLTGRIVFVSYRDQDEEIYIMNADGSNQTRLTYSTYGDVEPMLSPDGRFIVFVSQRAGGHKLFIMNSDGSNPHQLTDGKSSDEYDPYFSPDGQWIVYSSSRGGRFELWLIHPDGTGLTKLTSGPNGKNYPAWSQDGQWIAYNSKQGNDDIIKIIRPDGTGDQVIRQQDEAYVSGWIGERILFVANNGAKSDIYSMNPDGSDVRQLTSDPANDKGAFGTSDGRLIIFNSARDGNDEIYVMQDDGSSQTRITFSSGNDYMPMWGP